MIRAVQLIGTRVQASCGPVVAGLNDTTSALEVAFKEHPYPNFKGANRFSTTYSDCGAACSRHWPIISTTYFTNPEFVHGKKHGQYYASFTGTRLLMFRSYFFQDHTRMNLFLRDFDANCRLFAMLAYDSCFYLDANRRCSDVTVEYFEQFYEFACTFFNHLLSFLDAR